MFRHKDKKVSIASQRTAARGCPVFQCKMLIFVQARRKGGRPILIQKRVPKSKGGLKETGSGGGK